MTPPIRFLASAVGGWVFLRGAMLVPWQAENFPRGPAAVLPAATKPVSSAATSQPRTIGKSIAADAPRRRAAISRPLPSYSKKAHAGRRGGRGARRSRAWLRPAGLGWSLSPARATLRLVAAGSRPNPFARRAALPAATSRWTASAWLHARAGGASPLSPGGQLGGSQAGTRIGYRLSPALTITGRLSAPLRHAAGAEGAIGAEWQPVSSLPLRLLAERRQRLGRDGRSAWAATLHGGVGDVTLPAGFRLDAYGQAGAVGGRSRDLFAEGSARLSAPLSGGLGIGAGVWGSAQPGAARLDLGPSLTLRLPRLQASLSAEWRFRAAGGAQPGSGPALTLWTDF